MTNRTADALTIAACVAVIALTFAAVRWVVIVEQREAYIRGCERSGGTYVECWDTWDRRHP